MRNQPIGGIPEPYEKVSILSDSTKEGTVILVKNKTTLQEAVMKIFPTKKSPKTIEKEIRLQKKFYPLAPQIYKEGKNYFIMEKGQEASALANGGITDLDYVWIAGHQYCDSNYSGVAEPGCTGDFTVEKYGPWITATNGILDPYGFKWFLTEGNVRCNDLNPCPNGIYGRLF